MSEFKFIKKDVEVNIIELEKVYQLKRIADALNDKGVSIKK